MSSKMTIFAGSIFIALSALSAPPTASSALADCAGCDNAWHATAMLNGAPVFVVWNAEGQVVTEGD